MLCDLCQGLSISQLVKLAETELSGHDFPQQAFYQHHSSYEKLKCAAQNGCELCQLLLHGFENIAVREGYWEGETRSSAIEDLESSDIKICINSEHIYSGDRIENVRISSKEEPKSVGKYKIGRDQLDPDLASDVNMRLARNWLDECHQRHASCPAEQIPVLPSRVVDVGVSKDAQFCRILVSNGRTGKYVALSHCWGGPISPLLNTATLPGFQEALAISDLPANFRDAVLVTRNLGMQYLWIDSLCIIQDSSRDWEVESGNMCSIYQNATVTISASASRGSKDGFLKCTTSQFQAGNPVSLRLSPTSAPEDVVSVALKDEDEEDLTRLVLSGPLNQRGWTLQEGLLSSRILYYGSRQIYWQCPAGLQSAEGVPSGNQMPESSYPETSHLLYSQHQPNRAREINRAQLLTEYYTLVQEYSARSLSFNCDKFPAFAGIVQLLRPAIGGEYLAGIWSTDVRRGLLWRAEMETCAHVHEYRAPSWSWAVTNEPIIFDFADSTVPSPYDVETISHEMTFKSHGNLYGQVDAARLCLRGLTKKLVRSNQKLDISYPDHEIATVYFDEPEPGRDIEVWSSVFRVFEGEDDHLISVINGRGFEGKEWEIDFDLCSEIEYLVLLITADVDTENTGLFNTSCLVLAKVAEQPGDVYMRVGYLNLHAVKLESWTKSWERQALTIV
ncbi:hypothetical protein LHYA1_G004889 [Lachnellula hyalina]|uniref:Heterokaryon incompatibility domain-containing protein n=1 Tax=Lachnellula hyalina TaxID=1316788 RepID=A0A8H8R420_9HELO|nr:uncharacterized protein LHYA1_G004889 [Lachnellula hyalina]TVY27661.1 hypothetical protein LHYA1_G004889 [Lachnellula hyalina]